MRINPTRLSAELRAAALPDSCRSNPRPDQADLPPEQWAIDWTTPPTPAQLATARAVIQAHDPDADEKEEVAARARLLAIADKLDANVATAAEVREALAKLVRRHLGGRA